MIITPMQLRVVFPTCRNPGVWCRAFAQTLAGTGIDETPQRLAMFLAQCGHESESFNVLRELLSYRTVAQLRSVYPREFPTDDIAQRYIMNPTGLGNFIYANKLGNGDVESGDGFKFRGGGLIQLTGRANYEAAGKAIARDLILRPNDVIIEAVAVQSSAYFWNLKDLNAAADAGDFEHTTKAINPAMEGADVRAGYWQKLVAQLGAPTAQDVAVAARRAIPPVIDGLMDPTMNSERSLNQFNT
jgi:putative chitinase